MLKHFKHWFHFILVLLMFIGTVIIYSYFAKTEYFIELQMWAQANFRRFFMILVFVKALGIVWPPLPGVVLLIGSIPIIGWFPAFVADALGWYLGSSIAFWLSRRYGLKAIRFFFGEAGVHRVKKFKVNPKRELETMIIMKCLGGSVGEFINYAAGLTTIKFRNFFLANIIASFAVGLPLFYVFSFALKNNSNLLFALVLLVVMIVFFYLFRDRYFIWDELEEDQNPK